MFLSEFKISKNFSNFQGFLSKLISDNYNNNVLKESEHNIKEMHRIRLTIENINERLIKEGNSIEKQNEILLESKKNLINYSNYISKLNKKLILLNSYESKNTLKYFENQFQYFDILTNKEFCQDLNYEFLFCLYNLSIVYFNLGVNLKYQIFETEILSEDVIKEAIKDFQTCIAGLTKLKEKIREFNKYDEINEKENDFHDLILNFKICLCKAETQSLIFQLSKVKNFDIDLQINLAKGTFDQYFALENYLSLEPLKSIDVNDMKKIINYYTNLYQAIWYQLLSIKIFEDFKKNGINYGNGISFLKAALNGLNQNLEFCVIYNIFIYIFKSITNLKVKLRYLLFNEYKLYEISNSLKEKLEKNKIYMQPIVDIKFVLSKYPCESKNMVKEIQFVDDLENLIPDLFIELEPVQQKLLMKNFKEKLISSCEKVSNDYISEDDILNFKENVINYNIGEFNFLLNAAYDNDEKIDINSNLFNKIKNVQNLGGEKCLIEFIKRVNENYNTISNIILKTKNKIIQEYNEDNEYRIKFQKDEKAIIYKCDYSTIVASNSLNKIILEKLNKQEQTIIKSKECDKNVISIVEKLLIEPKLKIVTKENINQTTEFLPVIKVLTLNNLKKINDYISCLDYSKEKKKEAIEKFQKINEWNELLVSINELKQLVELSQIQKEKLRNLLNNLSDIDLAQLSKSSNIEELSKQYVNEIIKKKDYNEIFNTLDNLSKSVEKSKKTIISNCDKLKKIIYENKSNEVNQFDKLLNTNIFNYKNQDIIDFKDNIEYCCNKFIEIQKLIKFSDGFYFQQLSNTKNIEIQCVKFLIDRFIEKDAFLNKYNNNGLYNKTIGVSCRVNELNYYLVDLEKEKTISMVDKDSNPITCLNLKYNVKK